MKRWPVLLLEQELLGIMEVIYSGELKMHLAWQALLKDTIRVHLIGLVSDGGGGFYHRFPVRRM